MSQLQDSDFDTLSFKLKDCSDCLQNLETTVRYMYGQLMHKLKYAVQTTVSSSFHSDMKPSPIIYPHALR